MRVTSCKVDLRFIDVTARNDATITFNEVVKSNKALFRDKEAIYTPPYALIENNQFILDGSKIYSDDVIDDIAFLGKASLKDCTFTVNPIVTATFKSVHTSAGITLVFGLDYPSEVKVTWYSKGGNVLASVTEYPTNIKHVVNQQVQDYAKIEVEFIKTRFPKQRASLNYIDYGVSITWSGEQIKNASIYEEIDPTGATLSINTATIEILDEAKDFDISNNSGIWKSIQKTQEVIITEYIDGEEINMGKYYISDSSYNGNIATFNMVDAIGLLDSYTFYEGGMYTATDADVIIDNILVTAGVDYEIDEELWNIPLTGWVGIQTCREALQQICFAIGAIADDSRGKLRIRIPEKKVKYIIDTNRKFSSNVALNDYVSGVSLGIKTYSQGTQTQEIYNGVVDKGVTELYLQQPYKSVTVTGNATLLDHTGDVVSLSSTNGGSCVIKGIPYNENETSYMIKNAVIGGETEQTVNYSGFTVYAKSKLKEVTENLLEYHSMRKAVEARIILEDERVGEWITLNNNDGFSTIALIESQTIDLTGGFTAKIKGTGYAKVIIEELYTGTELYAGNGGLL